jgi:hypothetical protein
MTPRELDLLARQVFKHLAENVPEWRNVPIRPDDPRELEQAKGYGAMRRPSIRNSKMRYESDRRIITAAKRHLEGIGYPCSSIRTPAPGHISVRVAHAGSWRLCTRIPEDTAERVIILGFLPDAPRP